MATISKKYFDQGQINLALPSHAFALTPADADDYDAAIGVYVGGAGNVTVQPWNSEATVTFTAVPAGARLPCSVRRVLAAGTTATLLVGLI